MGNFFLTRPRHFYQHDCLTACRRRLRKSARRTLHLTVRFPFRIAAVHHAVPLWCGLALISAPCFAIDPAPAPPDVSTSGPALAAPPAPAPPATLPLHLSPLFLRLSYLLRPLSRLRQRRLWRREAHGHCSREAHPQRWARTTACASGCMGMARALSCVRCCSRLTRRRRTERRHCRRPGFPHQCR